MKEEIKQIKKKLVVLILLCIAILILIVATLAWFRNLQQLNTVSLVQIPSKLTLSGANRSELQKISLELTPDDTINGDGEVTLRRVFCVESTSDFRLEVVRTTNIRGTTNIEEGMEIKIYPVKATNSDQDSGTVKGNDGLNTYYYTPDESPLEGKYLNKKQDQYLAIQKDQQGTLHDENYVSDDTVQKNAEPLYWRTEPQSHDKQHYSDTTDKEKRMYYRYYVMELSWKTTDQETDMVYLLASH